MDKTLIKGLQVLEFVARANRNIRIADVSEALGLSKSNAYRALKTLEAADFLKQDPVTKDFFASMKIWELGMQVDKRFDVRARGADALRRLAHASNETVHLAVLEGGEVLYVDKIDSLEPVAAYTQLAGRAPAHCVATGKALLSWLPESELARQVGELRSYSEHSITDMDVLRAELLETRCRGFATNRGEWRESVWGIAAVIKDSADTAIAAIGVSGPRYRLDDDTRFAQLVKLVEHSAEEITATYQLAR